MKLKILAVILTAVLSLSGCQDADANSPTDYHETTITLGDAVALVGEGAVFDENMITIEKGGRYVVNGSHDQMTIVVDSKTEAATLVLNGVSLSNTEGPAILLQSGSDIVIELAEGTENFVADGGNSDYDGAIYGLVSYTIDGKGALIVQGNVNEGIASEENLTINDGIITVEAVDDGLNASHDGASQLTINDGQLLIKAGGDGIDSNGSLTINGGTIITMSPTTDMSGGIDADGEVLFNGGTIIASGGHNSLPSENSKQSSVLAVFADEQMAQSLMAIKTGEDLLIAFAPEKITPKSFTAQQMSPQIQPMKFMQMLPALLTRKASAKPAKAANLSAKLLLEILIKVIRQLWDHETVVMNQCEKVSRHKTDHPKAKEANNRKIDRP